MHVLQRMARLLLGSVALVLVSGARIPATSPRDALLVSPAWLAQHLNDPNLVVLRVGDRAEYTAKHEKDLMNQPDWHRVLKTTAAIMLLTRATDFQLTGPSPLESGSSRIVRASNAQNASGPAMAEHATSRSYNRALGVECAYCHSIDNFADAGKPTFDFARRMERMASGLSDGPLKDLGGVTCWSCHRGHAVPSRLPPDKWQSIATVHAAELSGGRPGLDLRMGVYSASLGVECAHCHVAGNWSDGSRRGYQMVGRMARMFDLIPSFFEGSARQPLTQCYMCHQGSVHVERD